MASLRYTLPSSDAVRQVSLASCWTALDVPTSVLLVRIGGLSREFRGAEQEKGLQRTKCEHE